MSREDNRYAALTIMARATQSPNVDDAIYAAIDDVMCGRVYADSRRTVHDHDLYDAGFRLARHCLHKNIRVYDVDSQEAAEAFLLAAGVTL